MTEKLQKVLANAGLGSRRQIEQWIKDNRISVNGKIAKIGDRVDERAILRVDGIEIKRIKSAVIKKRVLLYHKVEGEICSRKDPENRPTVFDRLPLLRNSRWISVGRLDFNTSGLLIFTNDGELANHLMHPSTEMEREYAVRVHGNVSPEAISNLKKGVRLEDGTAHFEEMIDAGGEGTNHWYHVIVKQGKNRIVRRLFESQDLTVSRLIRVRFGPIQMPRILKRGMWLELSKDEIEQLLKGVASHH